MPVLPTDILGPVVLISINVMLVSPNCPTLEKDDELKIDNIQFVRRVFPVRQTALRSQYSHPSLLTEETRCQTEVTWDTTMQETENTALQFHTGSSFKSDARYK